MLIWDLGPVVYKMDLLTFLEKKKGSKPGFLSNETLSMPVQTVEWHTLHASHEISQVPSITCFRVQ